MKCREVNVIEYVEGIAREEVREHIRHCKKCQKDSEKLSHLSGLLSSHYLEGKKLEVDLDKKLQAIELRKMEKLPEDILKKVQTLNQETLVAKVKHLIGRAKQKTDPLMENIFSPHFQAMPASPKDMVKAQKPKKKKGDSKRSSNKKKS